MRHLFIGALMLQLEGKRTLYSTGHFSFELESGV